MGKPKTAFLTGITGQDGSYLAELLLDKGYEVHGLVRRASTFGTERIDHLYLDPHLDNARMFLHYGDLSDGNSLSHLLQDIMPDEVYNLGAQSHVAVSFKNPIYTVDVDALGTLRLLEACRQMGDRRAPVLPGIVIGDVREGQRGPAVRDHTISPAQPVRLREGLRVLADRQPP